MYIFPTEKSNKYGLVLEYAGSTLKSYLHDHFDKLTWEDKCELAFQLTSAVSYLHEKEIVHCNLVNIANL
jgi:serine/threonine protein kinase